MPSFVGAPTGLAIDAQRAGHRLQHDVEGRTVAQRTRHSVARDRAVDQSRIDGGERFIAEAQAIHHAGPIVLDQDVALGGEILDQRHAGIVLQIDDDALLAAVDAQEIVALVVAERREQPGFVAGARRLDLQHFRAEIGQRERSRWPRQHASEVENTNSLQRTGPARSNGLGHVDYRRWLRATGNWLLATGYWPEGFPLASSQSPVASVRSLQRGWATLRSPMPNADSSPRCVSRVLRDFHEMLAVLRRTCA